MNELCGLLNKTKKYVISYLKEKNISYKYEKKTFIYKTKLLEKDFEVNIRMLNHTVAAIDLLCVGINTSEEFKELVDLYKEKMNGIYGLPKLDNTNHPAGCVEINYIFILIILKKNIEMT